MLCFRKFLVAKKFMDKKCGGDYLKFPSKLFCLTVPKHSWRNPSLLCFRKLLVAKKFMEKRGRGEYRNIPPKIFRLNLPKYFVGEPFTLSLVSGIENDYASQGFVTIFRRKVFVSQYRNFS